jgi:hypothetical protein
LEIGQSAGKSYAYILGVYLGDGCVTETPDGYPVFRVNTIDSDFAQAIKANLHNLSRYPVNINVHSVKKSSKPNHSLRCGDTALCRRLVAETKAKSVIPAFVMRWPKEWQQQFIIGLMDSEGFVGQINRASDPTHKTETNRRFYMGFKCCDSWIMEFVKLCEANGLRIGKIAQEKPLHLHYKVPTRFHIKMQSWIDSGMRFNIARKQARVDLFASAEPYTMRSKFPRRLTPETTRSTSLEEAMI